MIAHPAFSPYECELIALSTKLGGLGVSSTSTLHPAAYVASFMTCREFCAKLNLPKLSLPPRMASVVTLLNTSMDLFTTENLCGGDQKVIFLTQLPEKTLQRPVNWHIL